MAQQTSSLCVRYTEEPSKVDTIGTTTVCPRYGGFCNSGAFGIQLVRMVMCSWAVEHAFTNLSVAMMLRKASVMSNSNNIMPSF